MGRCAFFLNEEAWEGNRRDMGEDSSTSETAGQLGFHGGHIEFKMLNEAGVSNRQFDMNT